MRWRVSLVVAIAGLTLSACTSTTSESQDTLPKTDAPTSTVNNANAPTSNPPTGENEIPCDNRAISASYGERVKAEKCTATWAMGDTDRDSWQCDSDGCRQTRLFHLENNKWVNTATCDRTLPLTRYASSCFVPNVGLATADLIPPQDVACIIWSTNSLPQYAKETGCAISRDAVLASLKETCDDTFDATQLPLQKCDRGDIVRQLQTKLRELKFNISVSGFFGPDTSRAIFDFQEKNNLVATAIVDEETWVALGLTP